MRFPPTTNWAQRWSLSNHRSMLGAEEKGTSTPLNRETLSWKVALKSPFPEKRLKHTPPTSSETFSSPFKPVKRENLCATSTLKQAATSPTNTTSPFWWTGKTNPCSSWPQRKVAWTLNTWLKRRQKRFTKSPLTQTLAFLVIKSGTSALRWDCPAQPTRPLQRP